METDEKADAISHTANGSRFAAQSSDCSATVAVESAAPAGVYKGLTIFGAEDEVIIERGRWSL